MTLSTSQLAVNCELKIIHLIMSNLFFTFVVNISLSLGNSCYFLGNWVSLDQICALFIYFLLLSKGYCNYSSSSWAKGQNRTYTKNFFFKIWGGGGGWPHHSRPGLGSSLHVLLLRFSHVFFFFFHEMKVYFQLGTTT